MRASIDHAEGTLTGLAVGNLLGFAPIGCQRAEILQIWPDGVTEIEAPSGYPDDDDLAQAIVVAEAAAEGPLSVDDLGRRLWFWAEANGAGIGGLTLKALAFQGGDHPQRLADKMAAGDVREPWGLPVAEASKQAWAGFRAGNGALMRCAPLAIRWQADTNRLVRESIVSAVPTHWDPRCGWSCAIVNIAIAGALQNQTLSPEALIALAKEGVASALPELKHYGYEAEPPTSVIEWLYRSGSSSLDDVAFDDRDMGFTLLGMQAALISYWRASDFEKGLRQITEAGGDTDTNGAIVGAVLGARFGRSGIPSRWLRRTFEIRMGRVPMESYAAMLMAG